MLTRLIARLRTLIAVRRIADEIDDELAYHLEQETAANVARGMLPAEARRRALADLGGVVQTREAVHAVRASPWIASRQLASPRLLRHQPFYAVACVVTLALAVAAATTTAAVVKPAFFDPLPFHDDAGVVLLSTVTDGDRSPLSPHVLKDLAESDAPFAALAGGRGAEVAYATDAGVEPVGAVTVTFGYLETLGVSPAIGRAWNDGEVDAVVVSWSFWQRMFGGDESALGRRLSIDGVDRQLVGVMPRGFIAAPYWATVDLLIPVEMSTWLADPYRARRTLTVIGRRGDGVGHADVAAFLAAFSARLRTAHPIDHAGQSWEASPIRDEMVGQARPVIVGTAAAAAVLLVIVMANLAGVSAVRAVGLRRQTAVKLALGAGRSRLLAERVVESLWLGLAGSAAGVWLASVLVTVVAGYQAEFLPRIAPIDLPLSLALAALVSGAAIGTAAGAVPHLSSRLAGDADALRSSRGSAGDAAGTRLRAGLVATQAALALVLAIGAGLVGRTISHLVATPLGFEPAGLTAFSVSLGGARYRTQESHIQFERAVLERLASTPGVAQATASIGIPINGGMGAGLWIEGRGETAVPIHYMSVAPNFQQVLGVPLLAGRTIDDSDVAGAPRTLVVNATMARMFWPDGDAIGARVFVGVAPSQNWMTVVGIVGDVRQHGASADVQPTAFGSTRQYSWPRRTFTVRSTTGAVMPASDLRAAVREVDPRLAVGMVRMYDDLSASQRARHRLVLIALGCFGGVAFVLCAFGLYGVLALSSSLRRREYAIRLALGSTAEGVRWLVVRQALILAGLGVAAGLAVAWGATRMLQGLLHGVQPNDPATFAGAAAMLVAVAVAAAWLPARQAATVRGTEVFSTDPGA